MKHLIPRDSNGKKLDDPNGFYLSEDEEDEQL